MSQRLQIMPYDPSWASEFETERDLVSHALGQLARRIDHSGSTAVPGLEAKPIIDIQVSVEKLNPIRAYAEPLAGLGYRHAPHSDDAVCPFFHRPSEWPHSHHIHVVESGGLEEQRTLRSGRGTRARRPSSSTEWFRSLWHKDIRWNCETPSNNARVTRPLNHACSASRCAAVSRLGMQAKRWPCSLSDQGPVMG